MLKVLLLLLFRSKRPQVDATIHWVPDDSRRLNLLDESVSKLVIDRVCDDEAFGCDADLASICQATLVGHIDCVFKIGVLEDNEGIVSSQFKAALFHVFCAQDCHFLASLSATSEFTGTHSAISQDLSTLLLCNKEVLKLALAEACFSHCIVNGLCAEGGRRRVLKHN